MTDAATDVRDLGDVPLYRRYSRDGTGRAVRAKPSSAIWSAQIQTSSAFLCAERHNDFAFYTAQHALYRQLGLHVGDLVRRRAHTAQTRAAALAEDAARPQTESTPLPQVPAAQGSTTLRAFLAAKPVDCSSAELRSGIRVLPDDGGIFGYAWDKNRPKQRLNVVAFAGQKLFLSETANGPNVRWEDGQLITSPKRNGFQVELPEGLKDGVFVDAFVSEYRVRIEGFPLVVKSGRLIPPTKLQLIRRRLMPWRG